MNKTKLSKVLSVSSKYQITVPENVRDLMGIRENDQVIFTTDGDNVFFEKYVLKEENHLKLVTYVRSLLKAGAPVFISGDIRTGKSKLAKEIGSYGFEEVVYIEPKESTEHEVLLEKFIYATESFKHSRQLLILDEYMFLEQSGLISLNEIFYQNFKGSLILISQLQESIPLPPFHTHGISYNVHINDLVKDTNYEVIQHIADDSEPFNNKTSITKIPVNLELSDAITTWGALQYFKKQTGDFAMDEYFRGQQRAAIQYLEKHLYGNNIFTIKDLEERLSDIDEKVDTNKKTLGIYCVGLKAMLAQYKETLTTI